MNLTIKKEIQEAIASAKPVVALESTIISHGLPYPDNKNLAYEVEETIRQQGATAATIAIIDGVIKVGLEKEEIQRLASGMENVQKVSIRDIAHAIITKSLGSTTVAATMKIAHQAGISVFATGGIGGVHKGAHETFDISADLQALSQIPVTVVCAGAKSILDLRLTLEYLETYSVPLIGYKTDELPAFYTKTSGLKVPHKLDSSAQIARFIKIQNEISSEKGIVIANPIETEYELQEEYLQEATAKAELDAKNNSIMGNLVTPYLLKKIADYTNKKSVKSNTALMLSNAKLASKIACELHSLKDTHG